MKITQARGKVSQVTARPAIGKEREERKSGNEVTRQMNQMNAGRSNVIAIIAARKLPGPSYYCCPVCVALSLFSLPRFLCPFSAATSSSPLLRLQLRLLFTISSSSLSLSLSRTLNHPLASLIVQSGGFFSWLGKEREREEMDLRVLRGRRVSVEKEKERERERATKCEASCSKEI